MKALFEKVTLDDQRSMLVRRFQLPYFDSLWHYHPEYELTYISTSYGRRFVGDHVALFQAGDLVLLGPDLPHFWRNDEEFYQPDSGLRAESIVVQFPASFDERILGVIPEAATIRQLLQRARYGLHFSPATSEQVAESISKLTEQTGLPQLLGLVAILDQLATDTGASLLASDGYQLATGAAETERMKRVLEFILANFRDDIRIDQIASIAGMAPASFCRYFKNRTRETFIDYLNELRIGHARKLLVTADLSAGQVGLECGFNSNSHFHRLFKLHTGLTPFHYRLVARSR